MGTRLLSLVQNRPVRPPELRLRLAAILAADAVAYSRLMSADARATIEALETARRTFQTISVAHGGRVIDTAGDSVLAIFKTVGFGVPAAVRAGRGFRCATSPAAPCSWR